MELKKIQFGKENFNECGLGKKCSHIEQEGVMYETRFLVDGVECSGRTI